MEVSKYERLELDVWLRGLSELQKARENVFKKPMKFKSMSCLWLWYYNNIPKYWNIFPAFREKKKPKTYYPIPWKSLFFTEEGVNPEQAAEESLLPSRGCKAAEGSCSGPEARAQAIAALTPDCWPPVWAGNYKNPPFSISSLLCSLLQKCNIGHTLKKKCFTEFCSA